MDRKNFIKKGFLGTGIFITGSSAIEALANKNDELSALTPLRHPVGFNHLPSASSSISANAVLHRASSRGHANHGWLDTHHTFSFANYYNPERMHFGVLRVLNDDYVEAGMGFATHPHDNMEIISIPLEGDLEHKDSMGNTSVIKHGDIQVMSAGTGITHSEYNRNKDKPVKFLQIWLFPGKKNVVPRYDQITLDRNAGKNRFQQILSPSEEDEGVWIYQDSWFHLGKFDKRYETSYRIKKPGNGLYSFVIKGKATIYKTALEERDGLGVWNEQEVQIMAESGAEILLMDVPMSL